MAAASLQVLLPLVCFVLVEAHLVMPRSPHFTLNLPDQEVVAGNGPIPANGGYPGLWQHRIDRHHRRRPWDAYNPFFDGAMDPYFGFGPVDMGNFEPIPGTIPTSVIDNIFNFHRPGSVVHDGSNDNPKETLPADKPPTTPDDKPEHDHAIDEKHPEGAVLGDTATVSDRDHKLIVDPHPSSVNEEEIPPKTNEVKKDEGPKDKDGNNDKEGKKTDDVDLTEKKDYLLIGSDGNGNKLFLLHENNPAPNPVVVPNNNQQGNFIYVPYNPGQSNNQVYQVINGQPAAVPSNTPLTPDKLNANGFNNAIVNPAPSGNQNPNQVYVYYNGQLVPGVVVNQPQNNLGGQVQGSNVIIANAVPSNVQNPGSNVYYALVPNQPSNGQVCCSAMNPTQGETNAPNIIYSNGVPSNTGNQPHGLIIQPTVLLPNSNTPSTGYYQPTVLNPGQATNVAVTIPNQGNSYAGQNIPSQPAPTFTTNYQPSGYNQPIMTNQVAPNINQNYPAQPASVQPINSGSNGYSQPMTVNQGDPNMPLQPAPLPVNGASNNYNNQPASTVPVSVPNYVQPGNGYNVGNTPSNDYSQPMLSNQGNPSNAQNIPLQTTPVNPASNDFNVPNPGDQPINVVVNDRTDDAVADGRDTAAPLAVAASIPNTAAGGAVVLDNNDLSSLGAQPAVMISAFKETPETVEKSKDKKKSKSKKSKKNKKKKGSGENNSGEKDSKENEDKDLKTNITDK